MRRRLAVVVVVVLAMCLLSAGQMVVFADEAMPLSDVQGMQRLTIDEAGTYTLTGSMKGTVYVDPGVGDVTLILDGVEIEADAEPAIMAVSGDRLTIHVKEHTCNTISDSAANALGAAIYTEVDTVLEGTGCLQINGRAGYGVVSEDAALTFSSRIVLIVSELSGIQAAGEQPGVVSFDDGCTLINCKKGEIVDAKDIRMNGGKVESSDQTRVCDVCGCCSGNQGTTCCTQWVCVEKTIYTEYCPSCVPTVDEPGEIVQGITANGASALEPDRANAVNIVMDNGSGNILISKSGTYDISGKSSNGSITVAKGTQGVVLILHDLDLTSQSGAALRIDSEAQVKIVAEGKVVLKDASEASTDEDAEEEGEGSEGEDSEGEDESEGEGEEAGTAAIVIGDGASVSITGSGNLSIVSVSADGIKAGADSSLVIDGGLSMDIKAAEDGIHSEHDVAILNGDLTINAGDHAIHAEHILTLGEEETGKGKGKDTGDLNLNVESSSEGVEAAVVNIQGGNIVINSEEEGIETETFEVSEGEDLEASVNITGGNTTIQSGSHGIDSDGNINLVDGSLTIDSEKSCIAYDDDLYVSETFDMNCNCEKEIEAVTICVPVPVCVETPVCPETHSCPDTPVCTDPAGTTGTAVTTGAAAITDTAATTGAAVTTGTAATTQSGNQAAAVTSSGSEDSHEVTDVDVDDDDNDNDNDGDD